jgi:dynein intermediate chain 1
MPPKAKKNMAARKTEEEEAAVAVAKLSSLHSWIKAQTMIRPSRGRGEGGGGGGEDDGDDEFVTIVLTSQDPNILAGRLRWSHTDSSYSGIDFKETMISHLDIESTIINVFSEDGRDQIVNLGFPIREDDDEEDQLEREAVLEKYRPWIKMKEEKALRKGRQEKTGLKNQFSFIERASQTKLFDQVEMSSQTAPPPIDTTGGTVSASILYDFYMANESAREEQELFEAAVKATEGMPGGNVNPKEIREMVRQKISKTDENVSENSVNVVEKKMLRSAKLLERMVNLDTFDDVAKDYQFFEDLADEHRVPDGVRSRLFISRGGFIASVFNRSTRCCFRCGGL